MSRFDNDLDQYVYGLSLDGWCEFETGTVDDVGWNGTFSGEPGFLAQPDDRDYRALDDEDKEFIASVVGVIVSQDSQGFVSIEYYDETERDKLSADWQAIEDDAMEAQGPQDDDYTTEDFCTFRQGKREIEVPDGEEWQDVIRADMDTQNCWPNVWSISDHGNVGLLSLEV